MKILNLGILAHVDAGKTSLTELLLFNAGVISQIGSVDAGNTQTDSLALEKQRGITIKTAAVSFTIGDTTVNLLDTPGHPDFIAEVERVLNVLDAAVLVISAVEGVQAQTRILMRALQRLNIPTVIFVNKIDRRGARYDELLDDIAQKLTPNALPMGIVSNAGDKNASFTLYNEDMAKISGVPVFAGSAITGAGVETLAAYLPRLAHTAATGGQLSGAVFKIDRGDTGEKIAYIRLFSGSISTRDTLGEDRVTSIEVFVNSKTNRKNVLAAGEIGRVRGLNSAKVGDNLGKGTKASRHFAPPTLETAIKPINQSDKTALFAALTQMAEQDPLINLRQDDIRQELYVSLYGEVQKEVIQATLENDYGIPVLLSDTTTIYVERPLDFGSAFELIGTAPVNPFNATVGLSVQPLPVGSGVRFGMAQDVLGTMPVAFFRAVEETIHKTLSQGLNGWQVTDCLVTLVRTGYWPRQSHSHATFDKSLSSTASDFRNLTPLVLMSALKQAGTIVCEPVHSFELEIPASTLEGILPVLAKFGAVTQTTEVKGPICILTGSVSAARVHELQQQIPGLTKGEGVLEYAFDRYEPIRGVVPKRQRTDLDPLDRQNYLLRVAKGM